MVLVPPFSPAHVQVQGPEPDTAEAAPAEQRLPKEGTVAVATPLAGPQTPFVGVIVTVFVSVLLFSLPSMTVLVESMVMVTGKLSPDTMPIRPTVNPLVACITFDAGIGKVPPLKVPLLELN